MFQDRALTSSENYPRIIESSNGALALHGMGPVYGWQNGKIGFYITTRNMVGEGGRCGAALTSQEFVNDGNWHTLVVEKTADALCITIDTGSRQCAQRTCTAAQFRMKDPNPMIYGPYAPNDGYGMVSAGAVRNYLQITKSPTASPTKSPTVSPTAFPTTQAPSKPPTTSAPQPPTKAPLSSAAKQQEAAGALATQLAGASFSCCGGVAMTIASLTAAPSADGGSVTGELTMPGVSLAQAASAAFQSGLKALLASVLPGVSPSDITITVEEVPDARRARALAIKITYTVNTQNMESTTQSPTKVGAAVTLNGVTQPGQYVVASHMEWLPSIGLSLADIPTIAIGGNMFALGGSRLVAENGGGTAEVKITCDSPVCDVMVFAYHAPPHSSATNGLLPGILPNEGWVAASCAPKFFYATSPNCLYPMVAFRKQTAEGSTVDVDIGQDAQYLVVFVKPGDHCIKNTNQADAETCRAAGSYCVWRNEECVDAWCERLLNAHPGGGGTHHHMWAKGARGEGVAESCPEAPPID